MRHFASVALLLSLAVPGCVDGDSTTGAHELVRPDVTAGECLAADGVVIGSPGGDEIFRPEFRCPNTGNPPIGRVVPDPDDLVTPIATDGAVCCR